MKLPKQLKWLRLPGGSVFSFWFRFARPFFMLLFVATLFIGGYVWYENIYRGQWSEEEKQKYIESTFKETVFNQDAFLKAMDQVRKRADSHMTDLEVGKDIFQVYSWSVPKNK